MNSVNLYIVTFNSPPQLQLLLDSFTASNPELLEIEWRYIIDNSTDEKTIPLYDEIANRYGFTLIRYGNMGITGSRAWAALHFDESCSDYMLWFEDDMLLVDTIQLCKNGLNQHVEDWLNKCIDIINIEKLDFIKLSFSEYWGDHHKQWSWHNLSEDKKSIYFPDGNCRTLWNISGNFRGLSYLIGEVYYSNWPSIMTKEGNRKIFLDPFYEFPFEQTIMSDSFEQLRAGTLKSGIVIASLINHNRVHHYNGDIRKES